MQENHEMMNFNEHQTDAEIMRTAFMFGTCESTDFVGAEGRFSGSDVGEFCMYENREQRSHSKCIDSEDNFSYRTRSKWTAEDTGTVFGVCVSFLIVLAGTFGYIICVSLLITLLHALVPLAES